MEWMWSIPALGVGLLSVLESHHPILETEAMHAGTLELTLHGQPALEKSGLSEREHAQRIGA